MARFVAGAGANVEAKIRSAAGAVFFFKARNPDLDA
jgi:hypothetical protein